MKCSVHFLLLALTVPIAASAGDTLVPAGSIIQCTVSEPKLSSQVDKIGDPVLCTLSHAEMFGRATVPYGSYLVGQFVDYKDPGHFVGKGYVELRFDRLVVHDQVVPLDARVVSVPNYNVNRDGQILGNGHAVKDTVEWLIPVLWPLDLINLPRRGPRIVLKPETRLTLKVMDDVGLLLLERAELPQQQPGLQQRVPDQGYQQPYQQTYQQAPAPIVQAYAQPAPQTVIYNNYPAPQQAPQQQQQTVVIQQPVQQQPAPQQYAQRPAVVYGYPPPPYPYGYYRAYPY